MKRFFFFLITILFFPIASDASPKDTVESLLQQFDRQQNATTANAFFSYLEQQEFADEQLTMPASTPIDSLRALVWYWAAEWYNDQQQYNSAARYGKRSLQIFQKGPSRSSEADCLNLLSIICMRLTNYDDAARYALRCYELDKLTGDDDRISSSLNTLAGIYMAAKQPKEAEQYIVKAIESASKVNNPVRMAVLQGMASEVYHALGNDQEALQHIDEAIRLEQNNGMQARLPVRQTQRASVLIGLKRYAEAEQVLRQAIPALRQGSNRHSLGIACNKMGQALAAQNHEPDAVSFYREAAEIFMQQDDPYNEVAARKGLYEALWKSHPDEARAELERFNLLKDSIYSHTTADALARYNAEFGNDWLKVENHAEREAHRRSIMIGLGTTVLLALLAFGIWWVMRRRHQKQSHINAELSANIDELREKYRELHIHYDKALLSLRNETDANLPAELDREFIEEAVLIINQLIHEGQVDAATVAERMHMSLFQLRQRLSSLIGETPQSFIQKLRMRRARHLLVNHPELNVTEIATLCAYSDTPNFTRAFKRAFGVTPSQFIEQSGNQQSASPSDAEQEPEPSPTPPEEPEPENS